jgi:hypothetical protein
MKDYLKEVNPELADHEELLAEAARKQMLMSNGMSDLKENAETYENVLKIINEKGLSGFDNLEALE